MTTKTPAVPLFPGTDRPLTLEDAHDMAKRGYGPIEIEVYKTGKDGYSHLVRRRSPREICRDLVAVLGEYPEGGEEGIHPFPYYACGNCPPGKDGVASCNKYTQRAGDPGHGPDGDGVCTQHKGCKGYRDWADCAWPHYRRIHVFSVRGSSEGDYVHVESVDDEGRGTLILLSKTFQGRDAAWQFARNVADLLGV